MFIKQELLLLFFKKKNHTFVHKGLPAIKQTHAHIH